MTHFAQIFVRFNVSSSSLHFLKQQTFIFWENQKATTIEKFPVQNELEGIEIEIGKIEGFKAWKGENEGKEKRTVKWSFSGENRDARKKEKKKEW